MSELNAELSYSRVIVFSEGNVHGAIVGSRPAQQTTTGTNTRSCSPTKATQAPILSSSAYLAFRALERLIGNDRRESHTNYVLGAALITNPLLKPGVGDKHSIHEIVEGGQKKRLVPFVATAKEYRPLSMEGTDMHMLSVSACKSCGNPSPVIHARSAFEAAFGPHLAKGRL